MPRSIPAFGLGPVSPLGFGTALLARQLHDKEGPSLGGTRAEPFQRSCKRLGRRSVLGKGGVRCWWLRVASLPNPAHLIVVSGPGKPLLLPCRRSLCCSTARQGRVVSETPRMLSRFTQLLQGILPASSSPRCGTGVIGLLFEK